MAHKKPEIMVRLYKTLVRPHLEYCVSAWSPHYIKDKELLERVQHRFTRMIKEVRGKDYLDRLKELNLWTLEERRNRADFVELLKMYKGFTAIRFESLLWPPYVIGQAIIFLPCGFFLLSSSSFFFFPRLITATAGWISTIL